MVKLATWNVNSLRARLDYVCDWLELNRPDVLLMQETKLRSDDFPELRFQELGYHSYHHGMSQWNGVAILSRDRLEEPKVCVDSLEFDGERQTRAVSAITFGLRVLSVYVPNGRTLDDPHYRYKLAWLRELKGELGIFAGQGTPLVVGGDFNIAPSDRDLWSPSALEGMTHVSEAEREALSEIVSVGLVDSYRRCEPERDGFSWWDYRGGAFHRNSGMRIDLVLLSESLAPSLRSARVDRDARKVDASGRKPSDHAPVVIEFTAPNEEGSLQGPLGV